VETERCAPCRDLLNESCGTRLLTKNSSVGLPAGNLQCLCLCEELVVVAFSLLLLESSSFSLQQYRSRSYATSLRPFCKDNSTATRRDGVVIADGVTLVVGVSFCAPKNTREQTQVVSLIFIFKRLT